MPALPPLTPNPTRYPGSCLSLSTTLLHTITTQLTTTHIKSPSSNPLLLSIGSGTGLLEELLHTHLTQTQTPTPIPNTKSHSWRCEGVELPSVNKHLPEDRINTVRGTWALHPRADDAAALLFVYPRESGLVARYLERYMRDPAHLDNEERGQAESRGLESSKVQLVIWIGPRTDYVSDYAQLFASISDFEVEVREGVGIDEYETFVVLRRRDK
ncbi:hypothetical protein F5Y18DRAFT_425512 [Xylariaceae sp. FL1019]|nr:hypothetical protein F5Y18DRAFT_425512 [Xylariaceae sp. FL1019]